MDICEFCSEDITGDSTAVHCENGSYHEDCYEEWSENEESYWGAQYNSAPKVVDADLSEWGNPKSTWYIDAIIDMADNLRKS